MDRVGIYQAKARLSELIERVERGEEVTITKNHKAVARLVPARTGKAEVDNSDAVDDLIRFSKTVKLKRRLTQREMRELREWGRD